MNAHIHTTATHGLWVLSVFFVSKFLLKTWVGNHPDNSFGQALSYFVD